MIYGKHLSVKGRNSLCAMKLWFVWRGSWGVELCFRSNRVEVGEGLWTVALGSLGYVLVYGNGDVFSWPMACK